MATGFQRTFDTLAETKNDAAAALLIPALDAANRRVREAALMALLHRRSPSGSREVLRRLQAMESEWRPLILDKPGCMTATLRDAILGKDDELCQIACQAVIWLREYDLIPALINAVEDPANSDQERCAKTLLEMVAELYQELSAPRDYRVRRDPQMVRRRVTGALEKAISKFTRSHRLELVESFLMVAARDNAVLKQVLSSPHHACYTPITELLARSPRPGVMRLLLSFLDDPHTPHAALSTIARRSDEKFIQHLLQRIGSDPGPQATINLRRIESIPWLLAPNLPPGLDDGRQHGLVKLAVCSGMKRGDVFRVLEAMMRQGSAVGKRAAVAALSEFKGADANALALAALEDNDPIVQAEAVRQLRSRGLPNALTRLLAMVDTPHEPVKKALRETLVEFSFERFVGAYDSLDEEIRRTTGLLVRKVDTAWKSQLLDEMKAPQRTRRIRAVAIAGSIAAVADVEDRVIELLKDEDHQVRAEAARVLAKSHSDTARNALRDALLDNSGVVQEAASTSLGMLQAALPPASVPWAETPIPLAIAE